MPRRELTYYDPIQESSDVGDSKDRARDQGALVLVRVSRDGMDPQHWSCPCGCGQFPTGRKSEFVIGHDQRLRGMLQRAHLAGTRVVLVNPDGQEELSALQYAGRLSWGKYLKRAVAARRQKNREVRERARGSNRLIKVGTYEGTGQTVAIYDHSDGRHRLEFVTKVGEVHNRVVPAEVSEASVR